MSKKPHLTHEQVEQVKSLLAQGLTHAAAAREAGLSEGSVWRIARGMLTGKKAKEGACSPGVVT